MLERPEALHSGSPFIGTLQESKRRGHVARQAAHPAHLGTSHIEAWSRLISPPVLNDAHGADVLVKSHAIGVFR